MKEQPPLPRLLNRREVIALGVGGVVTAGAIAADYYVKKIRPEKIEHQEQEIKKKAVEERTIFEQ